MRDYINKRLEEAQKKAEELGATLVLDIDFIDDEHLDCIWYGGRIGSIEYKGFYADVSVYGEVRINGVEGGKYPNFQYVDKSNIGAYWFSNDITDNFRNDKELAQAFEDNNIQYWDNNWVEIGLWRKNDKGGLGDYIDSIVADDDNVLENMCDIEGLAFLIKETMEREND